MNTETAAMDEVARNVTGWLAASERLTETERRHLREQLSKRSNTLRRAYDWTEVFGPAFVIGALLLLGAVFVVLGGGPLWLTIGFVVSATVMTGVPAIKVWQCATQAIDIGVGACVAQHPTRDGKL